MIQQGLPYKEVSKEYKKDFGKPLSRTTFFDWKKNSEEIINSGATSSLVRTSYTLSDIRKQFDEDLLAEIEKTKQDVEGIAGISIMARKLNDDLDVVIVEDQDVEDQNRAEQQVDHRNNFSK